MKHKRQRTDPADRKLRFCDPGACHKCRNIEGGDFYCDFIHEFVVEDWKPTRYHLNCKRRRTNARTH